MRHFCHCSDFYLEAQIIRGTKCETELDVISRLAVGISYISSGVPGLPVCILQLQLLKIQYLMIIIQITDPYGQLH